MVEIGFKEDTKAGELGGRLKRAVEMRSPWIWAGEMRSGSSASPPVGVPWPSAGVGTSVSVSSSALSWMSPRLMLPIVSELEREKGGGAF